MICLILTLASVEPGRLFRDLMPWLIAIVGLAVVGVIIIMVVRRMLRPEGERAQGFTLQSLRDLRDRGQITAEEFERARESMIGRLKQGSLSDGESAASQEPSKGVDGASARSPDAAEPSDVQDRSVRGDSDKPGG